jgi:hypothetical protein
MVLLIPQLSSDSIQQISIDRGLSFHEVLEIIFEALPCSDVPCKPDLSYKLSSTLAKAPAVRLKNDNDWSGCLEALAKAEANKKKRPGIPLPSIPVNIIISESVSLCSFIIRWKLTIHKVYAFPSLSRQEKQQRRSHYNTVSSTNKVSQGTTCIT